MQLPPGDPFDPRELVGTWVAAVGTFGAVMDERWRFGPDGTGDATLRGSLTGTTELEFEWRAVDLGLVELRLVRMTDSQTDPADVDEEPDPWQALAVVSAQLPHEGGGTSSCVWTPPGPGFWEGRFPLTRER